jgi:hypothetical protein
MKTVLIFGLTMFVPALAQSPDIVISQLGDVVTRMVYFGGYAAAVKNAPYSADAVTETTQVLGDGNRIELRTAQKLYRDSDGRERREESVLPVGALAQVDMPRAITISDPVEKVSYTLDPEQRTARRGTGALNTIRISSPFGTIVDGTGTGRSLVPTLARAEGVKPAGAPGVKEDLGSKNIEGVIAQGTRTTQTIPAGQIGNLAPIKIVDEVWHSAELQMDVLTTHSDPRTGEVVYKMTNISRANPARSLFEPPADYTVTGPAAGGRGRGPAQK